MRLSTRWVAAELKRQILTPIQPPKRTYAKCPNLNLISCIMDTQTPNEKLNGGDVNPSFGARNRRLEVFCQAAVSIDPSDGSFDNPSAWKELKAGSVSGAFDDFDGPVTEFDEGIPQVRSIIDAVGKE